MDPLEKKLSDLIEELAVKVMSSILLRSTFGLTQAKKSCNGIMKSKFQSLDASRSTSGMIYSYDALVAKHIFYLI